MPGDHRVVRAGPWGEDAPRRVSLEVMLRGTCDRRRPFDMVENFTLFPEDKAAEWTEVKRLK